MLTSCGKYNWNRLQEQTKITGPFNSFTKSFGVFSVTYFFFFILIVYKQQISFLWMIIQIVQKIVYVIRIALNPKIIYRRYDQSIELKSNASGLMTWQKIGKFELFFFIWTIKFF